MWIGCAAPPSGSSSPVLEVDVVEQGIATVSDGGVVTTVEGAVYRAVVGPDGVTLEPTTLEPFEPADWPGWLPDSVPTTIESGRIRRAWLAEPTDRYAHGALGDDLEAGAVRITLDDGTEQRWEVEAPAVLEDQRVRPVDADGDGDLELWVVRAGPGDGAAPVLLDLVDDALVEVAAGEPIGTSFRWLAPVGAGDLDGDGAPELAWVVRPHLDGTLTVGTWVQDRLEVQDELAGFSNHAFGATALAMGTVTDLGGDGVSEIIVPDQRYRTLHVLDRRDGALSERAAVDLPGRMVSDLVPLDPHHWLAVIDTGGLLWIRSP